MLIRADSFGSEASGVQLLFELLTNLPVYKYKKLKMQSMKLVTKL